VLSSKTDCLTSFFFIQVIDSLASFLTQGVDSLGSFLTQGVDSLGSFLSEENYPHILSVTGGSQLYISFLLRMQTSLHPSTYWELTA
jgi:hypothetical protein